MPVVQISFNVTADLPHRWVGYETNNGFKLFHPLLHTKCFLRCTSLARAKGALVLLSATFPLPKIKWGY